MGDVSGRLALPLPPMMPNLEVLFVSAGDGDGTGSSWMVSSVFTGIESSAVEAVSADAGGGCSSGCIFFLPPIMPILPIGCLAGGSMGFVGGETHGAFFGCAPVVAESRSDSDSEAVDAVSLSILGRDEF